MEFIGDKIKRIRKEKGLSQSNLHENNSKVSQIESGRNQNPTAETLQILAKGLDVSFDELINGTSWENSKKHGISGKNAFSPLDFELYLNNHGKINIRFQGYPLLDDNGIRNKYCPVTGIDLIIDCNNCKKPIMDGEQIFCMGCGDRIFFNYERHIDELLPGDESPGSTFVDLKKKSKSLHYLINILTSKIKRLYFSGFRSLTDMRPETIKSKLQFREISNDPKLKNLETDILETWRFYNLPWEENKIEDISDYLDGIFSNNLVMAQWHKETTFKELYYKKIIEEIKKLIDNLGQSEENPKKDEPHEDSNEVMDDLSN